MSVIDKNPSPQNPPKRKRNIILAVCIISCVIAVLVSIFFIQHSRQEMQEKEDWKAAQDSASIPALIEFMRTYPNGQFYATADSLMQALKQEDDQAWDRILYATDAVSFKQYLERFPKGQYGSIALMKIDSLDWVRTSELNTLEAYTEYLRTHPQGLYQEDARMRTDKLASTTLTEEEKTAIIETMTEYYAAVESGDEGTVLAYFEPLISQYYTKKDATKADVLANLRKMQNSDITDMSIRVNNNFTSSKDEEGNYHTSFPIDITYERAEPGQETFTSSIVNATLNSNLKITSITSQKISTLSE